ncbi:hypothetical protein [Rubrivirga sp.]
MPLSFLGGIPPPPAMTAIDLRRIALATVLIALSITLSAFDVPL